MSQILVVDDEKSVQEALSLLLSDAGHSIDTAEDGSEALERLNKKNYDLILTDILMPKMNGLEFLHTIRQAGKRMPVIVITAHANVESAAKIIHAGACDLLIKPFEIKALLDSVRYVLQDQTLLTVGDKEAVPLDVQATRQEWEQKLASMAWWEETSKSDAVDIEKQIALTVDILHKRFSPKRIWLGLNKIQSAELMLECAYPADPTIQEEYQVLEKNILASLVQNNKALFFRNVKNELNFQTDYAEQPKILLAVPVKQQDSVRGGILLYPAHTADLKNDTLHLLFVLARLLGSILESNQLKQELNSLRNETVQALFTSLEVKDASLASHAARVACFALLLGKRLGLSEVEKRDLEYFALLHDLGKIYLPDSAFHPEEELKAKADEPLRSHTQLGENIIRSLSFLPEGGNIIRHHHEWFNGQGYPDGLQGKAIPLLARILRLADAFDALVGEFSPQDKRLQQRALQQLMREAGKQFDPELLNCFVAAYREVLMLG